MDFQWNDTQVALYDEAVAFGRDALSASKVRAGLSMEEIWPAMAGFGATGLIIPETWGGSGLSALSAARVLEDPGEQ
jgi:alkylation response protein AidB-like acyl-CoA dehydrogenase